MPTVIHTTELKVDNNLTTTIIHFILFRIDNRSNRIKKSLHMTCLEADPNFRKRGLLFLDQKGSRVGPILKKNS